MPGKVNNKLHPPSAFRVVSQLFSETLKDILRLATVQQDWKEGRPVNQIEIVLTTMAAIMAKNDYFDDDDEDHDDLGIIHAKSIRVSTNFLPRENKHKKCVKMHKSIMNSNTFSLKMRRNA